MYMKLFWYANKRSYMQMRLEIRKSKFLIWKWSLKYVNEGSMVCKWRLTYANEVANKAFSYMQIRLQICKLSCSDIQMSVHICKWAYRYANETSNTAFLICKSVQICKWGLNYVNESFRFVNKGSDM